MRRYWRTVSPLLMRVIFLDFVENGKCEACGAKKGHESRNHRRNQALIDVHHHADDEASDDADEYCIDDVPQGCLLPLLDYSWSRRDGGAPQLDQNASG